MNRRDRRRAGIKEKPNVYNLTEEQLQQMIDEAVREVRDENRKLQETIKDLTEQLRNALLDAFLLCLSIPSLVLHDKFNFGKIRQERFQDYSMCWFDAVQNGETTLEEIRDLAREQAGYDITKLKE